MNGHGSPSAREDRESGFTLIEVLIAGGILATILLVTFRLISGAQTQYATSSLVTVEEMRAEDVLRILVDRVRNGGVTTLADSAGNLLADGSTSNSGFRVRLVTGYSGGPVFGPTVGFRVEADGQDAKDDKDNDQDGRIDESLLYQDSWPSFPGAPGTDPTTTLLVDGLQSLSVRRVGNTIEFTAVLRKYDPVNGRTLSTSATQSLLLRN